MKQRFLVVYEYANGSYSGYAPDLPGCISAGGNHEEMRKNMREAVGKHLELLIEQGKEIPAPGPAIVHCPPSAEETDVQHWIVERLEIEVPISKPRSEAVTA